MEKKDVAVILGMLRENYGQYTESPNPEILIELWYRYLCDEPALIVQQAIDKWMAENKFAPKVAEILESIEKIKWKMWEEWASEQSLYMIGEGDKPRDIPNEFLPHGITKQPKQYEQANMAKILKGIEKINGGTIGGAIVQHALKELGLLPEGEK